MSYIRRTKTVLLGLVVAATASIAISTTFGLSVGPIAADAAPAALPAGILGVGEITVPPIDRSTPATEKVVLAEIGHSKAMDTPVSRKSAPVPKKIVSTRASGSSSSRSGSSSSGWSSARVSWYGPGFYGNTMAGGGKLTESSMVVAHRSMAFGTRIQFEYKGRTCTAVVQDRGPFVGGRTFDLGPGTAKALGFSGVGTVKYRILGR